MLAAVADAVVTDDEWRVVHGCVLTQKRNSTIFTRSHLDTVVTALKELPDAAARDLIVASTAIKYTQSNSVAFAVNGQAIGIGAGQQSRVDCVKLAARKLTTWFMRQHPSITGIRFKAGVKRQDKVNARVRIIEGNLTPEEMSEISAKIEGEIPAPLSEEARVEFMKTLPPISLSSDAFFPYVALGEHLSPYPRCVFKLICYSVTPTQFTWPLSIPTARGHPSCLFEVIVCV